MNTVCFSLCKTAYIFTDWFITNHPLSTHLSLFIFCFCSSTPISALLLSVVFLSRLYYFIKSILAILTLSLEFLLSTEGIDTDHRRQNLQISSYMELPLSFLGWKSPNLFAKICISLYGLKFSLLASQGCLANSY